MFNKTPPDWFRVKELQAGLYGIGEFGHYEEVLSFLLVGNEEALLIDTGLGFFSMKGLVESITRLPCRVVNTHSHFDHIGSNFEFDSVAMFDHEESHKYAAEGIPAGPRLARWTTEEMFSVPRPNLPDPYTIHPFPQASFFQAGDRIELAPFSLEILHTPGHSDDSVSFYDAEKGILFPGDVLYDGPIFIAAGGWPAYRQTLAKYAALPRIKHIYPSHNGFEFTREQFQQVLQATKAIASLDETHWLGEKLRLDP